MLCRRAKIVNENHKKQVIHRPCLLVCLWCGIWHSPCYTASQLSGCEMQQGPIPEGSGPCSTTVSIWWHVGQFALTLMAVWGDSPRVYCELNDMSLCFDCEDRVDDVLTLQASSA